MGIEQLAQSIVETVREPLVVLDADLRVEFANRAFYHTFKVARETTEGVLLFHLGSGEWDIPELRRQLIEILPLNSQFEDFEVNRHFPLIGHKVMLLNARRLYDLHRHTALILLAIEDITARHAAEEQLQLFAARLERSNRELQDFASIASHDLQEPLRKILAFGERLKLRSHGALDDQGRDYLERMQNAAARMQRLINDLLKLSRIETNAQPFSPVSLAVTMQEVLSDLEVQIEQANATVEVGELPEIEADPLQMRQLLQNLVGNALKYRDAERAPQIKVTATLIPERRNHRLAEMLGGDYLCQLVVEDNGIGFDEKYLDRIFTIFERLHGRKEYEGTGVGLAVCRKIAERHHGSITARSRPGSGARFIVTLPVQHPPGVNRND